MVSSGWVKLKRNTRGYLTGNTGNNYYSISLSLSLSYSYVLKTRYQIRYPTVASVASFRPLLYL